MKKVLLLFLLFPTFIFSQTSFSCSYKSVCSWNNTAEKWQDCKGAEDVSLIVMNEKETMFTHTTETISSTYYVKKKREGKDGMFTYDVVSDVGNKYFAIFDISNKMVKMVSTSGEVSTWFMVEWQGKAIF